LGRWAGAGTETEAMYLRFVITKIDEDSHQPQGLFRAAHALIESAEIDAEEKKRLQEILIWFNRNLPAPDKPYITGNVTFWFKTVAQEHIRRMWDLVHILRAHGHLIEVHKRAYLYDIVYWDEHQVAARFSRADGKRTIK